MRKSISELEEKLNKVRSDILVLETLGIKPNYSELSRIYNVDRRTIQKYKDGYSKNKETKNRKSKLEPLKDEIKEKLELPGATITGVYQYFNKDEKICTYSNFYKFVKKFELKPKKKTKANLRFETDLGQQLQFDWKEDIQMISKHGEVFEFNIFSATLGASRLHVFLYSKLKTRIDVQRCLVETFEYLGGVTKELLTDNMSSIVNTKTGKFYKEFISFAKDMGTFAKHCKPRHPYTKGKDESANRFMSWLVPYNHEFEDEQDLIRIIKEINLKVNNQVNSTIGVAPVMLYKKEKEYLKPLPSQKLLQEYKAYTTRIKVSNESLFYYKGKKYSVSPKFIDHTLDLQENDNKLYVYYNKELITMHQISEKNINYKEEHYIEGLQSVLQNKEQNEIEDLAKKNLERLRSLN